jgi:hypothetical protein
VSWVKLDDGFADHPKIIALTPQARDLFIWGLCYCARQLTDGFVPKRSVSGCGTVPRSETRAKSIAALIRAGLWVEVEGGWQVHDYLDYQEDRARVLRRRAKQLERWRRWKANQEETANAGTNAVSGESTNATPGPSPSSIPKDVVVDVGEQPRPEDPSEEPEPVDAEGVARVNELAAKAAGKDLPF